jgi:hypothetical protein
VILNRRLFGSLNLVLIVTVVADLKVAAAVDYRQTAERAAADRACARWRFG